MKCGDAIALGLAIDSPDPREWFRKCGLHTVLQEKCWVMLWRNLVYKTSVLVMTPPTIWDSSIQSSQNDRPRIWHVYLQLPFPWIKKSWYTSGWNPFFPPNGRLSLLLRRRRRLGYPAYSKHNHVPCRSGRIIYSEFSEEWVLTLIVLKLGLHCRESRRCVPIPQAKRFKEGAIPTIF